MPEEAVQQNAEPTEATEPATKESTHQAPEASFLKGKDAPRMDIPEAGLFELYVIQQEQGNSGFVSYEEMPLAPGEIVN